MGENISLQTGEAYFASGDYHAALEVAQTFFGTEGNTKDASLLAAKSALNLTIDATDKKSTKIYYDLCEIAVSHAETLEEVFSIEHDIRYEWNNWYRKRMKQYIDLLREATELKRWGEFIEILQAFTMMDVSLYGIRMTSKVQELCDAANTTLKEIAPKLTQPCDNTLSNDELRSWIFDAAKDVFQRGKALVADCDGTSDYVKETIKKATPVLYLAECMFDYCVPKENDVTANNMVLARNALKKAAEVRDFLLNALVRFDGKTMSLTLGDDTRKKTLEEIESYYLRLSKLDPDFVAPALPSVEAIEPAPPKSGGCYVATCVYGSYDCPQVWTLRRFRDYTLAETWYGRAFIRTYYAVSPTIVKWFGRTTWFKKMWKGKLDRLVYKLQNQGVESVPYQDRIW